MVAPLRASPRIALALAMIAAGATTHAAPPPARRPNTVFILADDLGWTDLGRCGSRCYETPHIDRLAAAGVRFTNHHHCPNCTPTRP